MAVRRTALPALALTVLSVLPVPPAPAAADRPEQLPLAFPGDEGAHPGWKTEWWYVTGWLEDEGGAPLGFQVTFFRNRGPADASHASRFAPHQILLAHAAVSDPRVGHILHEERAARAGFGLAEVRTGSMGVHIEDWRLERGSDGVMRADIAGSALALALELVPTQDPLLEGEQGLSRKGHDPRAYSWYYSLPQLQVTGTVRVQDAPGRRVHGRAWLDHEWSNAYVSDNAVGWDWTGLDFNDGSALMAFRMRDRLGQTLWSSGTWRDGTGRQQLLGNGSLQFDAGRRWVSPATGASYPVEWRLRWPGHDLHLVPLMDDQEMDTRASTGTAYWEGAVSASDRAAAGGAGGARPLARGYLELTGYWKPLLF